MPRSMARHSCGVYRSSEAGSFGRMVMTPPEALISSSWPLLNPARRRTAGGTTSGVLLLFLMATVMVGNTVRGRLRPLAICQRQFHIVRGERRSAVGIFGLDQNR